jgi:hypothetical protein
VDKIAFSGYYLTSTAASRLKEAINKTGDPDGASVRKYNEEVTTCCW